MKTVVFLFAVIMASASAFANPAGSSGSYDMSCPLDGGLILVQLTTGEVALQPSVQDSWFMPMRTIKTESGRCPGCVSTEFDNGLPGAAALRVDVVSELVQVDGMFVPGNHRASVYVKEAGDWAELGTEISCNTIESK